MNSNTLVRDLGIKIIVSIPRQKDHRRIAYIERISTLRESALGKAHSEQKKTKQNNQTNKNSETIK